MEIPKNIKVAGHNYKIIFNNDISNQGLVGTTSFDFAQIKLCKYYKKSEIPRVKSEIEETFWHEVLHIIDRTYNNLSLKEKTINNLSVGLYQVLKDNFIIKVKGKQLEGEKNE